MPDTRSHRGLNPQDAELFSVQACERLRLAVRDLSWLLTQGYAVRSATELVGNRYNLEARQRTAVARCACSDQALAARKRTEIGTDALEDQELWIDGLNVLTGLEVALSGGIILIGRDGCCRDLAGLHRNYRKVEETLTALELIIKVTRNWGVRRACWLLDRPVSNTGRLREVILDIAGRFDCDWKVELAYSPDAVLCKTQAVVVSSDSAILDLCQTWFNLVGQTIHAGIPTARTVNLANLPPF